MCLYAILTDKSLVSNKGKKHYYVYVFLSPGNADHIPNRRTLTKLTLFLSSFVFYEHYYHLHYFSFD